ncbi:hypothetical protein DL762_006742 [Monosporascus cannonballus]|uniref:Cryptic loci regulator 2 N-terminal domain-containing protein n=1 Tax=Monosporascus cannonballus TaxID=155416 RepID=A0ABY0H5F0_9PEZI|nr:hypothetical protein DL762_006742 [Monosporascus cannonballus]
MSPTQDDPAYDDLPQDDPRIVIDAPRSTAAAHDQSNDGDGEHLRGCVRAPDPAGPAHEAADQSVPVPNFYRDVVIPRRRQYRPLREPAVSDGDSVDAAGEAGLPGPSTRGGATWPIRDGVDEGQPGHGDLRGAPDGASRDATGSPVARPLGCPSISGFGPAALRLSPCSGHSGKGATAGPSTAPQGHIGTAPPNAPRSPRGWRADSPMRPNPNGPPNNQGNRGESSSRPIVNCNQVSGSSDDHPSLAGRTPPRPPVPLPASPGNYSLPSPDNYLPPGFADRYFVVQAISDPDPTSQTDPAVQDHFDDGPGGDLFDADPDFVGFKTYVNRHIQGLGIEPTSLLPADNWRPVTRRACLFYRWLLSRNEWPYGSKLPGCVCEECRCRDCLYSSSRCLAHPLPRAVQPPRPWRARSSVYLAVLNPRVPSPFHFAMTLPSVVHDRTLRGLVAGSLPEPPPRSPNQAAALQASRDGVFGHIGDRLERRRPRQGGRERRDET